MLRPFVLYSILILLPAFLQGQHPVVRNYTVEDGLPSSEVYHVIQDRHGYIWFSTDNGVSRFNGYEFENFDVQDGLPDNTILEMYEDYKGRIWFVSLSNKLSYFWNDSIFIYSYNKQIKSMMKESALPRKGGFYVDTNDVIYYSPQSSEAFSLDVSGNITEYEAHDDSTAFSLKLLGDDKVLWSNFLNKKKRQVYYKLVDVDGITHQHDYHQVSYIRRSVAVHNDTVCFLALYNKLYRIDGGELSKINLNTEPHWISYENATLWLGTPIGAYEVDLNSLSISKVYFRNQPITSILKDKENGYWFTSLKNGAYYIPFIRMNTLTNKILSKRVYRLAASEDKLLLGYDSSAFSSISTKEMVKHYTISEKNYSWVMDIEYSESNDCFWIGSAEKIYCFDGHTIKSYKNTLGQDFNCKEIELSDKGLWIGRGSGIYFWRNGHVEEVHFKHKDINKARTYSLLNDENNLWIGNINGLYKFTLDSISYLGVQNELLRNRINDIEKLNSILLLATNGAGILFYDKLNGEVFQLETNNSDLPSNSIQDIYIESDSIIWGATNSGAFRLKIKNLKEKKFKFNILSSYNGLPSKEVNDIELFLDKVFFATNNGLAFIDKDEIRKNRTPPKIHIRKLLINNRIVDFNFFNQFDADKNTIAIEYIGLSYRKAGDLNYKFRMNGLDTTWVHTKQRIQRFTTLEPGKYSFEVFAQNEDGVWSSEPAVYSFQINKPFYQQWWFLVLAFMLFFASFWIIYKRRINALRKKNLLLQSINSYKQRILSQQMNPHFIFNTLNSIQYYLLDEDINASLHYLSQFAKLMRQILDNSQRDKITIEEELDALRLYLELESLRFEENFEYKITVDKKINTFEWKILPLLLQPYVENAIKHGLLHKKGKGLISIKLNMADKKIQCIIEDNGVGRAFTLNKNQNRGEGHVSWGAKISSERIALLNSLYGDDIKVIYTDLKDENNQPLGTRVEIFIPVLV